MALSNTTWKHNRVLTNSAILLYETIIPTHLNIIRFTHLTTKAPPLPTTRQSYQLC